ncbi:MAG: hypothetical protein C4576_24225 [Desulfobacteraceae bacterium]|nr:MAG: hypothetical protein C4576_24225 [Desulfobacteraceae bacterium]
MNEQPLNPSRTRGRRNVFCWFYSKCLDVAIERKWKQWNCAKCEQRFNRQAEPEISLHVNHNVAYYEVSVKF